MRKFLIYLEGTIHTQVNKDEDKENLTPLCPHIKVYFVAEIPIFPLECPED
jgi:hypothetical protein